MKFNNKIVFVLILAVGVAFQSIEYFSNRSLNVDEAAAAVYTIGPFEGRADWQNSQAYPIGFLLLEKAMLDLGGYHEWALRLFPFACGLLSLFLFARVSTMILASPYHLWAITFFAVSPRVIYYSSEMRPYSTDLCLALVILLLAVEFLSAEQQERNFVFFALWGAVAICFSHPAVFVLAGSGLALAVFFSQRRDKTQIMCLLKVAVVWTFVFLLNYFLHIRSFAQKDFLLNYWAGAFMPFDLSARQVLLWLKTSFSDFFHSMLYVPFLVGGAAALIGWLALFRRRKLTAVSLTTTVLLVLLASALKKYPFSGRLLLFLIPIFIVLMAEAFSALGRQGRPFALRALSGGSCLVLLFFPLRAATLQALDSHGREGPRDLVECFVSQYRSGDAVFMNNNAHTQMIFYFASLGAPAQEFPVIMLIDDVLTDNGKEYTVMRRETFGFDENSVFLGKKDVTSSISIDRGEAVDFGPHKRAWLFLFKAKPALKPFLLDAFSKNGIKRLEFHRPGADLWRFDI